MVGTDAHVMGHTVIASGEFIMDVTNNLVILKDIDIWNQSAEYERLIFLEEDTYYGVNRAFSRELSDVSYEIFNNEGNLDGYLQLYEESLRLWPWAGLTQ